MRRPVGCPNVRVPVPSSKSPSVRERPGKPAARQLQRTGPHQLRSASRMALGLACSLSRARPEGIRATVLRPAGLCS